MAGTPQDPTGRDPEPPASEPTDPTEPAATPTPAPSPTHHRPKGLIALCAVLGVAAAGCFVWALVASGDDDDGPAVTTVEQTVTQTGSDDEDAALQAVQDELDDVQQQLDETTDALADETDDARERAQQALDDVKDDVEGLIADLRERLADDEPTTTTGG